jgi:hypothetical protein
MRTNDILINENSSPYLKRLVLMKRAGITLSPRQLNKLNESVSMVHPPLKSERDRVQASMMKQFKDLDDDEELDLSELFDDEEYSDEEIFDQILREMGYGEDEEEETIRMEDIPPITDKELEDIIRDLEYATGERDSYD